MIKRLHIVIHGAVQGVGFRPFIFRLATEMNLVGWVMNSPQGVFTEVEGEEDRLQSFMMRIEQEKPPLAYIESMESSFLEAVGYSDFIIRTSDHHGDSTAVVLPDIATCPDCLREIFDPTNRRYLYPFTNCTNCGPRYTIIEGLPYDRRSTSMKSFTMCDTCRREYENPHDRRFHAQPNACAKCGPHLELWDEHGNIQAHNHLALQVAAEVIRQGKILALKGIGGFHLIVDARNEEAVLRLRERKHREEKPLALMYPNLDAVKNDCDVTELEESLLRSAESPIVLLRKKSEIVEAVAPNNPYLGIMLPYSPLHHLLMKELGFPIVATSGNLTDEPICTDEREAIVRLKNIADVFLVHNRPIIRHVDDSVVRVMSGRVTMLRRSRGYAPLPIVVDGIHEPPLLAVGAHLKNTIAMTSGKNVFISQHIGDLETREAFGAFTHVIESFQRLYNAKPETIVCDFHPDYLSSSFARNFGRHVIEVQHHYAHVASCMAEHRLNGCVLGVSWDGTGYGTDGTIWGGEFLLTNDTSFDRVATLRSFRLPGGDQAIKEPRRAAIGVLYELFGNELFDCMRLPPVHSFSSRELSLMHTMLESGVHSPATSSVGRLFDAVASILGVRQRVSFEGQAAMELEFFMNGFITDDRYSFMIERAEASRFASNRSSCGMILNWGPFIIELLDDLKKRIEPSTISTKFHNTLSEIIVEVARIVGEERVILTGGCFQNKYLTERTVRRLTENGFHPYWHQHVPPNDGGIALGQIYAALKMNHTIDYQHHTTKSLETAS